MTSTMCPLARPWKMSMALHFCIVSECQAGGRSHSSIKPHMSETLSCIIFHGMRPLLSLVFSSTKFCDHGNGTGV